MYVIPNILDERWFEQPPAVALTSRPLLWVGKLDDHKRWRPGLDVMDRVLTDSSRDDVLPLVVGGYTTVRSERIQEFLAKLYSTRRLAAGQWWPYVEYTKMPLLYRSVAEAGGGMLLTSRNESFGMTVAEALVMGCPVVAPAVGALPELLPAAGLYEFGDEDAARKLTGRMLDDTEFRADLLSTRDQVMNKVHPERAVESFLGVLAEVIGESGAAGQ